MEFSEKVFKEVSKIPRGEVATYSEIARRAGNPNAARAVGNILHRNENPVLIPCHRVVRKDGSIGGYSGGVAKKIKLLKSEGVKITKFKGKWKLKK